MKTALRVLVGLDSADGADETKVPHEGPLKTLAAGGKYFTQITL